MKYIFASLLCHRDVEVFKFNWFCMRAHLDHGFDIPHIILSDGSLSAEDVKALEQLPRVTVEEEPMIHHEAPKAALLGKLEALKRGFDNHQADRVIVFDSDIFFLKSWDGSLLKMLTEKVVVLRDWGSSLGPNVEQYKDLFGVHEDRITPNCNTGVISVAKEDWHHIEEKLELHLKYPFQIMEDQGIIFASFYGDIKYADDIKCLINGAEYDTTLWNWTLQQKAVHLMGMRTRPLGLNTLVDESLNNLPNYIHLSQFKYTDHFSSWGLFGYGTYNFTLPLQKIPSKSNGQYITDALYMHGGSWAHWKLPERCSRFKTRIECMDTGIKNNVKAININGKDYKLGDAVDLPINGYLHIKTEEGSGVHLAFLEPRLKVDKSSINLVSQFNYQTVS